MAKPPRKLNAEMQSASDMRDLMARPAFHRFLFTIMQRSGISTSVYGSEVAASYAEGRRSLGIEILQMADEALSVRLPDGPPFAAMHIALTEALRSSTQEQDDEADLSRYQDDEDEIERR